MAGVSVEYCSEPYTRRIIVLPLVLSVSEREQDYCACTRHVDSHGGESYHLPFFITTGVARGLHLCSVHPYTSIQYSNLPSSLEQETPNV